MKVARVAVPAVAHRRAAQGQSCRRDGVPGDGNAVRGAGWFDQESAGDGRVPGNRDGCEADGRGDGAAEVGVAGAVGARGGGHGDRTPPGELGNQRIDGGQVAEGVRRDGVGHDAQLRPAGHRQDRSGQRDVSGRSQPGWDGGGLGHRAERGAEHESQRRDGGKEGKARGAQAERCMGGVSDAGQDGEEYGAGEATRNQRDPWHRPGDGPGEERQRAEPGQVGPARLPDGLAGGGRVHAVHTGLCGPPPGPGGTFVIPGLGVRRGSRRGGHGGHADAERGGELGVGGVPVQPGSPCALQDVGDLLFWQARHRAGQQVPGGRGLRHPGWRDVAGTPARIGPGRDHGVADLHPLEATTGLEAAQATGELVGWRAGGQDGQPDRDRLPRLVARHAGQEHRAVGVAGRLGREADRPFSGGQGHVEMRVSQPAAGRGPRPDKQVDGRCRGGIARCSLHLRLPLEHLSLRMAMGEGRIEQVRRQDLPERQRLVRPGGQVREHLVDRRFH